MYKCGIANRRSPAGSLDGQKGIPDTVIVTVTDVSDVVSGTCDGTDQVQVCVWLPDPPTRFFDRGSAFAKGNFSCKVVIMI